MTNLNLLTTGGHHQGHWWFLVPKSGPVGLMEILWSSYTGKSLKMGMDHWPRKLYFKREHHLELRDFGWRDQMLAGLILVAADDMFGFKSGYTHPSYGYVQREYDQPSDIWYHVLSVKPMYPMHYWCTVIPLWASHDCTEWRYKQS